MFERRGVSRLALFDVDEKLVGTEIYGIKVYHIDELYDFCQNNNVDIGVLTVPKDAAYHVAKTLASAGVRGIWNFANMELSLEDSSVVVENIHLGDSLMTLCYEVKDRTEKAGTEDGEN
jgi:redox-sensing transcriptional repressor